MKKIILSVLFVSLFASIALSACPGKGKLVEDQTEITGF